MRWWWSARRGRSKIYTHSRAQTSACFATSAAGANSSSIEINPDGRLRVGCRRQKTRAEAKIEAAARLALAFPELAIRCGLCCVGERGEKDGKEPPSSIINGSRYPPPHASSHPQGPTGGPTCFSPAPVRHNLIPAQAACGPQGLCGGLAC